MEQFSKDRTKKNKELNQEEEKDGQIDSTIQNEEEKKEEP
jgi:hypothetical protein